MALANPPLHIVMFGRPGSGKSSLAERLGSQFGYQLVRTGEMLREASRRGDFIGTTLSEQLSSGNLVSDELILDLLAENLTSSHQPKLLFDGFPRTLGQVAVLDSVEERLGLKIDCFLDVAVTREDAIARMTGRRVCPTCGATYHLIAKPPRSPETCDADGAKLERRKDDSIDVVTYRQKIYDDQTQPVIDHYRQVAPELCRVVNGNQAVDAVYRETLQVLGLA